MNISISTLVLLLLVHWVADFVMQSSRVAINKSKSNSALLEHVVIYGLHFGFLFGPVFGVLNAVLHFMVDYCTSRMTSFLWREKRTHDFFVVIGADQFLHYICLVGSYLLLQESGLVWIYFGGTS